jgi:soluble lytic murein transglycosylase-like protein
MKRLALSASIAVFAFAQTYSGTAAADSYDALVAMHAAANGVPASLVRRVIARESRGNARAVNRGNYGLMQIRLQTARGMGYSGSAAGLLDANTNMTYAVKYLAGAYRAAGGNQNRAVALYASGYFHAAKRQGLNDGLNDRLNDRAKDAARIALAAPDVTGSVDATRTSRRQRYAALQPQTLQDVTALGVTPARQVAAPRVRHAAKRARVAIVASNPFAALFAPQKPRGAHRR